MGYAGRAAPRTIVMPKAATHRVIVASDVIAVAGGGTRFRRGDNIIVTGPDGRQIRYVAARGLGIHVWVGHLEAKASGRLEPLWG